MSSKTKPKSARGRGGRPKTKYGPMKKTETAKRGSKRKTQKSNSDRSRELPSLRKPMKPAPPRRVKSASKVGRTRSSSEAPIGRSTRSLKSRSRSKGTSKPKPVLSTIDLEYESLKPRLAEGTCSPSLTPSVTHSVTHTESLREFKLEAKHMKSPSPVRSPRSKGRVAEAMSWEKVTDSPVGARRLSAGRLYTVAPDLLAAAGSAKALSLVVDEDDNCLEDDEEEDSRLVRAKSHERGKRRRRKKRKRRRRVSGDYEIVDMPDKSQSQLRGRKRVGRLTHEMRSLSMVAVSKGDEVSVAEMHRKHKSKKSKGHRRRQRRRRAVESALGPDEADSDSPISVQSMEIASERSRVLVPVQSVTKKPSFDGRHEAVDSGFVMSKTSVVDLNLDEEESGGEYPAAVAVPVVAGIEAAPQMQGDEDRHVQFQIALPSFDEHDSDDSAISMPLPKKKKRKKMRAVSMTPKPRVQMRPVAKSGKGLCLKKRSAPKSGFHKRLTSEPMTKKTTADSRTGVHWRSKSSLPAKKTKSSKAAKSKAGDLSVEDQMAMHLLRRRLQRNERIVRVVMNYRNELKRVIVLPPLHTFERAADFEMTLFDGFCLSKRRNYSDLTVSYPLTWDGSIGFPIGSTPENNDYYFSVRLSYSLLNCFKLFIKEKLNKIQWRFFTEEVLDYYGKALVDSDCDSMNYFE